MKFGEKIKELRKKNNMTQAELGKAIGVSFRTIQNYELAGIYPRKREIYGKLAEVLGVEEDYLLTEKEEFVTEAREKYGRRGEKDAQEIIEQVAGLFAGGDVTEDTKDEVMMAIQQAYWYAKKENVKYTPKKYRKDNE